MRVRPRSHALSGKRVRARIEPGNGARDRPKRRGQHQTEIDELVAASADGTYVPMRIPAQNKPHTISRMWVPRRRP
ncbi:hypothetical protein SSPIM334S_07848 [Streptomyces spiroverticillatus]